MNIVHILWVFVGILPASVIQAQQSSALHQLVETLLNSVHNEDSNCATLLDDTSLNIGMLKSPVPLIRVRNVTNIPIICSIRILISNDNSVINTTTNLFSVSILTSIKYKL